MKSQSSTWRGTGGWLLAGLLMISLFGLSGCGRQEVEAPEPIRPVRAIQIGDIRNLDDRQFPGRAKATQEVNMSFRVSGPLKELPVNVGDEVEEGQLLARIDPRDFEVDLENAQGQLDRARANLKRAQSDYDRLRRIYKEDPGATSEAAIDQKLDARDQARAQVRSLEASVESAKDQLDYTKLRAPFNGIVVAKYVENFEDVRAKQEVLRLVDDSHIEMVVNVPESLIRYSRYVTKATVVFDPFPGLTLDATVKEVGKEASETTRTYPVTLIMEQPEGARILAGMAGKARAVPGQIPDAAASQALEIPGTAVLEEQESGKNFVWVIDESSKVVARREVGIGKLTDRGVQVLSGVEPGEWIATAGVHTLQEGQQVRIME